MKSQRRLRCQLGPRKETQLQESYNLTKKIWSTLIKKQQFVDPVKSNVVNLQAEKV